jgi:hypothetical protein
MSLLTPVAFLIFKRPDTTQRVFDAIRESKPQKLLVVADGPRDARPGEAALCDQTRSIIKQVDWECEVLTHFSDTNLGCKKRISTGLDWVFNTVEEAIILEDDCLPNPTFFHFCEELLGRYRHDSRIMSIAGNNFLPPDRRTPYSYYFSRYSFIWGWASWRRAWQYYDVDMKFWTEIREGNWLEDVLIEHYSTKAWAKKFQSVYDGEIDTWDFQWTFSCWLQSGLSIVPNENLTSNIGFGADATHTTVKPAYVNSLTEPISFPLQHPPYIIRDNKADCFVEKNCYHPALISRIKKRLKLAF